MIRTTAGFVPMEDVTNVTAKGMIILKQKYVKCAKVMVSVLIVKELEELSKKVL